MSLDTHTHARAQACTRARAQTILLGPCKWHVPAKTLINPALSSQCHGTLGPAVLIKAYQFEPYCQYPAQENVPGISSMSICMYIVQYTLWGSWLHHTRRLFGINVSTSVDVSSLNQTFHAKLRSLLPWFDFTKESSNQMR